MMTSVGAITTQSQYLTTLLTPHTQLQVGNFAKQAWDHFSECASTQLGIGNSSISVEDFSVKLIDIAAYTIQKSKPSVQKRNTIWYNDECKEARSNRKKALQKVKSSPTDDNIQRYKIIRAKTRMNYENSQMSIMAAVCFFD